MSLQDFLKYHVKHAILVMTGTLFSLFNLKVQKLCLFSLCLAI